MPKVIVVSDVGYDLSSSASYGQRHVLLPYGVRPVAVLNLIVHIDDRMNALNVDADDFLITTGSPHIAALVFTKWIHRFGKINLLVWDSQNETYIRQTLTKEEIFNDAGRDCSDLTVDADEDAGDGAESL